MRRYALAVFAVLGLLAVPATVAHADPSAAPTLPVPSAVPGQPVCTVDTTLYGLTGLVATADGYAVVNQANSGKLQVSLLSNSCQRSSTIQYTGNSPSARDPRDLAMSADGSAFWVADTGDSVTAPNRTAIAVWKLPTDKSKGTIYRYVYPQSDLHSADAMLLNGDGTPIFVARVVSGPSGIYVPAAAPDPSGKNVPLKKAGDFTPQLTGTDNRFGKVGQQAVTGGANSPDGKHVVLRTLSDAYEWSVPDGDVVKALTTGTPLITPLPSEPQGEAITYSHDGKSFLTVSNQGSGTKVSILSYKPTVPVAATKPATVGGGGGAGSPKADTRGWFSKLSLQQLTYLVGGVGLVGLLMVIGGVLGIRAARRRPQPVPTKRTRPAEGWPDGEERPDPRAGGFAQVPDARYQQRDGLYEAERYEAQRYEGADYPPAPGGYQQGGYQQGGYPPAGYQEEPRYPDQGWAPQQPQEPQRGGRTYRAGRGGQETGHYEDSDRGGPYSRGGHSGAYQGGGHQGGGSYEGNGYDGGGYDGGGYGDGGYGAADPGGYQPPVAPPQPSGRDGGIARSHRTKTPKARGAAPARGGYAEEHAGFDDLRRLSEED